MENENKREVRTRFAPSPTGYLHVGGVRTALFAWLVARQANGKFLLRIEDTDRERHVEEAERHILDSLEWMGMKWDGEIYRQSEHLNVYKEWAQKLIDKGRAYADPRSPDELNGSRLAAKQLKKPFLFRDYRPDNPPIWDGSQPLRLKSEPKAYKWHDEVMGDLSTGPEAIDDFIIMKSDGYPTYNFAHIVDDHIMEISHVMRSQEFASSIPKFLNLYEALEIERPKLALLPYVLAPDGKKKLSKRDGAKDALQYRREGFLPEALINFLATLGWNDGTEQEIFSIDELLEKFSLERVQRSGARFDERRLLWMNGHYIREMELPGLGEAAKDFWPGSASAADDEYKMHILALVQERLKFLNELPGLSIFFFEEPKKEDIRALFENPSDKKLRDMEKHVCKALLAAAIKSLEQSNFSTDDIAGRLNGLLEELQTKPGILFALIRIAITGQASSPELFGTLNVLGKEKSLARLGRALELV